MFDDVLKQLKKLERTGISVPIKSDDEGYFDKECPNEECLFQFKVFGEDWTNLCKDEAIHCPQCGHQAPSKSWWTKEQLEAAKKQAFGQAKVAFNHGLREGARKFNLQQRSGWIKMSIKVPNGPTHHTMVPVAAQEAMKLKIQCESCSTRFAVIGSAFFCPCCGFNSVERTFDDSLKKVETKLDHLEAIRTALEEAGDKDGAQLTCRSLIETGLSDCVVAFQKIMEALYLRMPGAAKPSINIFQRIEDSSKLWKQNLGQGYEDWVSESDLKDLKILFHRRHLLAHTEGFVDERYIERSGDTSYSVGQRIVVRERDVRHLVSIVRALAKAAREKASTIAGTPP